MPQADTAETIAILAIGFSVFLGALQLKPHYRFLPILTLGGYAVVVWGVGKLLLKSEPVTLTFGAVGVVGLGVIAGVFALETYRSSNVQDYIHVWERNFENWDGGKPNDVCDLTERLIDDKAVPAIMRLSIAKGPAKFTPVFQSQYDSIAEGAQAWLTIWGQGLQFQNDQLGEWRPVLSDTTHCGKFLGEIDCQIHAGKSKFGPDGIIKVRFPTVGDYKVDYKIEGESSKGCEFTKEGHFIVQIYREEAGGARSA